jgi:hypothetical protein
MCYLIQTIIKKTIKKHKIQLILLLKKFSSLNHLK